MSGHCSFSLPFPPSTNRIWRTRRGANGKPSFFLDRRYETWKRACDNHVMAMVPRPKVRGRFTVSITLDETKRGRSDADNRLKALLDFLQRVEIIEDDKFADSVTVRWGFAPDGCRVDIRPSIVSGQAAKEAA